MQRGGGTQMAHPIDAWHEFVESRDPGRLDALLADDVVFHSPVVHTPQRGKAITLLYLRGAMQVLGTPAFRYEREIRAERDALLEFSTQIDGIAINGVDLIRWDDAGRIVDFKVMVRPLKAINLLHRLMGEELTRQSTEKASAQQGAPR
jgi:SnoaL-like protein